MLLEVQLAGAAEQGSDGGRAAPPARLLQPPLQLLHEQIEAILLRER